MTMPITAAEFETLTDHSLPGSMSLFMPTYRAGFETQQNPIRFKNLLAKAERKLIDSGWRRPDAEKRLRPLHSLLSDGRFWQNQMDGLALFYGMADPLIYRLPLQLPEMVVTGDHFHLKPLIPLLAWDISFYILALSQGSVQLLQAGRFHVHAATPEKMPRNMDEVSEYYETERILQWHTSTPGAGAKGERAAMFHGHGVGTDDRVEKKWLTEYCYQVNGAVQKFLQGSQAPLVLAATEPLLGIYRQINGYPYLQEQVVNRNPENLRPDELRQHVWPLVIPHYELGRQKDMDKFRQLAETELATSDTARVVTAAHDGQIDRLFIALDDQVWGTFDAQNWVTEIHEQPQPGDRELLELTAVRAFLSGATIHPCRRHEMPADSSLAATFRFKA
jgi:hypothetical protein